MRAADVVPEAYDCEKEVSNMGPMGKRRPSAAIRSRPPAGDSSRLPGRAYGEDMTGAKGLLKARNATVLETVPEDG